MTRQYRTLPLIKFIKKGECRENLVKVKEYVDDFLCLINRSAKYPGSTSLSNKVRGLEQKETKSEQPCHWENFDL